MIGTVTEPVYDTATSKFLLIPPRQSGTTQCDAPSSPDAFMWILPKGRFGSILLKKSTTVSAAEKHASENEIFTFGRGFQKQISRSSVQKWRSH